MHLPGMSEIQKEYAKKLGTWAMYALAVTGVMIVHALVQRWVGVNPQVPPPPVPIIVTVPDGVPVTVTVKE